MADISFYHLTATPLERALPKLLERIVGGGSRALLVAGSEEELERLNHLLWTHEQESFLPHGSEKDGEPENQPILLVTPDFFNRTPAPAAWDMLVSTSGYMPAAPEQFTRILDMFDGRDGKATEAARARWAAYKTAGHALAYQKQNEAGRWEKMQ